MPAAQIGVVQMFISHLDRFFHAVLVAKASFGACVKLNRHIPCVPVPILPYYLVCQKKI